MTPTEHDAEQSPLSRRRPKARPIHPRNRPLDVALGRIAGTVSIRSLIDQRLLQTVVDARASGATWAAIAEQLGTSPQAAIKRWAKYTPDYRPDAPPLASD